MTTDSNQNRTLGLVGATSLGVGAIVGGGILALAGVAFQTTGPSAILAFALNGLIALLTVSSFSEMSTAFPESGGPYTFAKKVLTIRAAFAVGWVVWFASIVASVLYALGFAAFGMVVLEQLWQVVSVTPSPLVNERLAITVLALGSIAIYSASLIRRRPGGTQWATIGKVVLFVFLIVGGVWALSRRPSEVVYSNLAPFFANGTIGLFQAMGFTFIALQGYDLIAAVAGEVREPVRVLPRAMLLSLAIALAIYLPLLFIVSTVVVPVGESIVQMSSQYPETVIAVAAENFLGRTGFWLVLIAAALSMLSALYANLFAASKHIAGNGSRPHFAPFPCPGQSSPRHSDLRDPAHGLLRHPRCFGHPRYLLRRCCRQSHISDLIRIGSRDEHPCPEASPPGHGGIHCTPVSDPTHRWGSHVCFACDLSGHRGTPRQA